VWPGWMRYRPELLQRPLIIARDAPIAPAELDFLEHPNMRSYAWNYDGDQRRKMLASFVLLAPRVVQTPWFLKLDTDVIATQANASWCSEDLIAGSPAFVSNPWGYTKPATAINTLDDWGDTVPELAKFGRLKLPFDPTATLVKTPGRIISWCFFGRTDWCSWAAGLCNCNLPVPSHDTYLWYVARRSDAKFTTVKMTTFGWSHQRLKV